ncbi:cyclic nucleotide-binding domain-containing protein [Chloroflexi bacterium]|nr:cyclic nucleotide-binding domain-containing protein [Chloroflexota bacterium]
MTPILLANLGFAIALIALLFRDILWLRVISVLGTLLIFPMYIFSDEIGWTSISWNFAGVVINSVQIVILILLRRPLLLKGVERQIHISLFYAITTRTFDKIFKLAKLQEYAINTELIHIGDPILNLYLVINGNVEVILHDGTTRIVSSNTFLGEQAFITGETASATVRILSDKATLLKWDNQTLQDFLDKDVALSNTFDLILTSDIIEKLRRMGS